MLEKPLKKSEGRKRFRAVIDTPVTDLAYTDKIVIDNFKSQTFIADGKSPALTMFQCCHCSYKTLSKQLLDEHLGGHNVASLLTGASQTLQHSENGDIVDGKVKEEIPSLVSCFVNLQ